MRISLWIEAFRQQWPILSPNAELMIWNLKDHKVSALACPGYFTSKKSFGCFARRLNELGAKEHSLEKLV